MTKVLIPRRFERYFVSIVTFVITFDLPFQNNFLLIEVKNNSLPTTYYLYKKKLYFIDKYYLNYLVI